MEHAPFRRSQRQLSILVILIVAVATPATLALSYYHITGDPTFRPLALSVERMLEGGQVVATIEVQAIVTTDGTAEGRARSERFGQRLGRALYGKGLGAHVSLHHRTHPGPPQVVFVINRTRLGPFTERTAAQGIQMAAEAATIARGRGEPSRDHNW